MTDTPALAATGIRIGYDERPVVDDLDLVIAPGTITALVGPNASGKSTLLKGLSRLLPLRAGRVCVDGAGIAELSSREVARRLGVLPQSPVTPEGITVADLVARGRHPHRHWLSPGSVDDLAVVADALVATGTADLAARPVDSLSGGQRQRVWIALALAQQTPVLLLDEPTTFLDLAHQIDVLDLLVDLRRDQGKTIVMVLHDLEQAAAYADRLVVLSAGAVVASGPPAQVLTEDLVRRVFGLECRIVPDPDTGSPLVLARGRHTLRTTQEHTP